MKNPIVYYTESESTINGLRIKSKFSVIKESMLQSIISDIFTFGILLVSFWVNQNYIHSKMVSCILLVLFLISAFALERRQRLTKEEFKAKIKEFLEEEDKDVYDIEFELIK